MKVFYNPNMSTPSHGYSPSGSKPAAAVADWQARGLDIQIVDFEPATKEDLYLAHDKKFVDNVLSCREANGHGNRRPEIAESCRWTVGSMMAAAEAALTEGITCSPSSGFHHAGFSVASGFCTFNGLLVAAIKMIRQRSCNMVGIIDCDAHWFDGVVDICDTLGLNDEIKAWSYGGEFSERKTFRQSELIDQLGQTLSGMKEDGVELIIYQAGADPYENDPLSGPCGMTIEQLRERDRFMFRTCLDLGLPIAYDHAGGYAKDAKGGISEVLEIHRNTIIEAIDALDDHARNVQLT
jgi:acetoin utilization deacetylase AcuC-like enzyme